MACILEICPSNHQTHTHTHTHTHIYVYIYTFPQGLYSDDLCPQIYVIFSYLNFSHANPYCKQKSLWDQKALELVLLLRKIFCLYFRTFSLVQQNELRNNDSQAPYSSSIDSSRFSFWLQESNIPYCYMKYNSSHNITKRKPS